MWFVGYNFLLTFLFLLTLPFTPLLPLLGKRFSAGLWQRFGFFPPAQVRSIAGGWPVWIHASSVGEVRSVATLVQELKARHTQRRILLSTFTFTGNEIAKKFPAVGEPALCYELGFEGYSDQTQTLLYSANYEPRLCDKWWAVVYSFFIDHFADIREPNEYYIQCTFLPFNIQAVLDWFMMPGF